VKAALALPRPMMVLELEDVEEGERQGWARWKRKRR
jgi:hypothetical protein